MLRRSRGILPTVRPSAYVDESAQRIGDVDIGRESSVWMNVVIRGGVHRIRIGQRTSVQDGTIVHVMGGAHPTTIGDEVTIGHVAVVHGCTIEDRCLVGMGVILLDGAHNGAGSFVAAGTLVTEDTHVPPRLLVMGRPGRVVRRLVDEEVASIREYADRYVGYRLNYMKGSSADR